MADKIYSYNNAYRNFLIEMLECIQGEDPELAQSIPSIVNPMYGGNLADIRDPFLFPTTSLVCINLGCQLYRTLIDQSQALIEGAMKEAGGR